MMIINCFNLMFTLYSFLFLQLFGYFQSSGDDTDLALSEDISVFTVSKKIRVGEASGIKHQFCFLFSDYFVRYFFQWIPLLRYSSMDIKLISVKNKNISVMLSDNIALT